MNLIGSLKTNQNAVVNKAFFIKDNLLMVERRLIGGYHVLSLCIIMHNHIAITNQ